MSHPARKADYPIHPMFLERWSPRSFSAETITEQELLTMLEAARWAASSSNVQPWRFIYARRDTYAWATLLDLLVPGNKVWAKDAAALVFLLSDSKRKAQNGERVLSPTHTFDAGAASACFALQAHLMGWFAHGMAGFDAGRAFTELKLPEGFDVHAVYAVGKLGDPAALPEAIREREFPSDRKPLSELAFEGEFRGSVE